MRRACGLERALGLVSREVDWKREASKKNRVSKVEWDLRERYYVRASANRLPRVAEAGEEAGLLVERGAVFHNRCTKSSEAAREADGEQTGTPLFLCLVLADPCT